MGNVGATVWWDRYALGKGCRFVDPNPATLDSNTLGRQGSNLTWLISHILSFRTMAMYYLGTDYMEQFQSRLGFQPWC